MHFGRPAFAHPMLVLIAVGTILAVFFLIKRRADGLSAINLIWIGAVSGAYLFFTVRLWKSPEEAVHFLEYGVLSYFAYAALRFHVKDISIFFTASLMTLFVGTVDEIIQWLVPGRYWDIRDVGFNFLGGVLLQITIYKGFNPRTISRSIEARSVRTFSIVLGACIVLLGLCASNTPSRIADYSKKIPFLSYLRSNHSMMSDYGYKHRDFAIGIFYSRFTKERLRKLDRLKSKDHSDILNSTDMLDFGQFLRAYSPFTNPFLYEMRIHLFRRDRYATLAEQGDRSGPELKKNATIAFKENLILEKYFGETLKRSRYQWPAHKTDAIKSDADTYAFYKSPVSSDLFTLFSERHLWALILSLLFVLFILNLKTTKDKSRSN